MTTLRLCAAFLALTTICAAEEILLEEPAMDVAEMEAVEPEPAAPAGFDEQSVWWGNRSISHDNYIKFEPIGPNYPVAALAAPADFDKFFFDLDKAVLRPSGTAECDKLAAYLRNNPGQNILVQGHTCDIDDNSYNNNLGMRRANAVRDCLISRGISPDRIMTESFGESSPWVGKEQRELNRRAVVVMTPAR